MQTVELLEQARAFAQDLAVARRHHPVRRHEEAGQGRVKEVAEAGRHALRERALAGRPADQLQHDPQADRAAARPARGSRTRASSPCCPTKERMSMEAELREARDQPQRRAGTGAPARRRVRRRPEGRGDRRAGGEPARHPDDRPRGHELRPGAGRLRDPGQRRRDPLLRPGDPHDRRGGRGRAAPRSCAGGAGPQGGRGEGPPRGGGARASARPRSRLARRPRSRPQRGGRAGRQARGAAGERRRTAPPQPPRRSPSRPEAPPARPRCSNERHAPRTSRRCATAPAPG